ncbi:bacillithiol biosynthesis deacetylase BshB1 [Fulvivirgaceae bacterium BMA12]|uniref:Bacillithiol biosynthesis deacetylase BshB1 n=1 Tax=Agaribacillus aureus TaxID=3051825 RepID=A0ABT8KYC7_9BACT|nr:bacillithiol biosynthesis deacetylase BshB1 [Fulvivirgaceae bacterium BMA12]
MKLDMLVFAAHPDDAELACSGTIISHINQGKKVGIVDFTRGELGTRGNPKIRMQEAQKAAEILGLSVRINLGFEDIYFKNDKEHQLEVVKMIRKFQPDVVLANAVEDRHPDHPKASQLTVQACFMAGLKKIETRLDGEDQSAWRPGSVYHYIQSNFISPDIIVDVSDYWEQRMASVKAFKSQFFDPDSKESETYISSAQFLQLLEARATDFGKSIGVKYGEGFTVDKNIGIKSLFHLL